MNEQVQITCLVIGGLIIIFLINAWSLNQDVKRTQAAWAYERCVQKEYGMTPIQWYEEHKEYPLCGN